MDMNNFTVLFSPSTLGFYPSFGNYDNLPEDIKEISIEEWHRIIEGEGEVGSDADGYPILNPIPTLSIEELRETMVISKVKAMQNLKKAGKLNAVLDLMDTLPRDNDMRILWDYSENLRRTDATLVKVCTEQLGLDDLGIDNLFM